MEYSKNILKRLQKTECEMLKRFDQVCKKYNIRYFAIFGTAIGAVRHHGFIPWDDDIDVGILREDEVKLRNIPNKEWQGKYTLVFPDDDISYHRLCFPRLYMNGTIFIDQNNAELIMPKNKGNRSVSSSNCFTPIWIDIQVFDRISSYEDIASIATKKIRYRKMYRVAKSNIKITFNHGIKFGIRSILRKAIHCIFNLIKKPEKLIYEKYCAISSSYGKFITNFDTMTENEMYTSFCKYENLFPLRRIPFEDIEIPVPNNINAILTNIYGNYMTLPPIEKRVNHTPYILDFGDGINVIMGN